MSLNPYAEPLKLAENNALILRTKLTNVKSEIDKYESINLNTLQEDLKKLNNNEKQKNLEQDQLILEIKKVESELSSVLVLKNSLWNPKNWFDVKQREIRNQARRIQNFLQEKQKTKSKFSESLQTCKKMIKAKEDEVRWFEAFNFDSTKLSYFDLSKQLSEIKKQIGTLRQKKSKVDDAVQPILNQINNVKQNITISQSARNLAKSLEDELSNADNSYERAMVHQKCEKEFGMGNPNKVISKKDAEIRRLGSDLLKLEKRARNVVLISARDIKQLIIDGNNLCYEGDSFIGLKALKKLTQVVSDNYQITLVFDASIRRILQIGDSEVRNLFGNEVKIHVVATSIKADETVLDLAGVSDTTYVISNDRFAEFHEKKAVKDQRIIRHEIVGGRILIHDLGVAEIY